jgi:hypothetical protein
MKTAGLNAFSLVAIVIDYATDELSWLVRTCLLDKHETVRLRDEKDESIEKVTKG